MYCWVVSIFCLLLLNSIYNILTAFCLKKDQLLVYELNFCVSVIDCPDEGYLDCLLNHPGFLKYQDDDSYRTCLVVHMSSSSILFSPEYRAFIKRLRFFNKRGGGRGRDGRQLLSKGLYTKNTLGSDYLRVKFHKIGMIIWFIRPA